MSYQVVISEQAERDLRDIFEYIAIELAAPENAAGQLDRLEQAIKGLDTFPEVGHLFEMEPWKSRKLRMLPVDNYCLFYIPDKTKAVVTVIRIMYKGRDSLSVLNEERD